MTIANSSLPDANDVLNIYHHGGNSIIGKTGLIYIPIIINNASGVRNVYLQLWGKKASHDGTNFNHGLLIQHSHLINKSSGSYGTSYQSGNSAHAFTADAIDNVDVSISVGALRETSLIEVTNVPQAVEIWIDGTQYTSTIGDPNSKGATMYDSSNNDWGTNGTTEWDTGVLNLTSLISWTAGLHYIELKETGGTGGTIIYHVSVNTGYNV